MVENACNFARAFRLNTIRKEIAMLHPITPRFHLTARFRTAPLLAACLIAAAGAPGATAQFNGFSAIEPLDIDPVIVQRIAMGDFNDDGRTDVAMTSSAMNKAYVLINNGNGSYEFSTLDVNDPQDVMIADINDDGKLDIAIISGSITRFIRLFEGDGEGSFVEAASIATSNQAARMVVADFDGDEILDILLGDTIDGELHLHFGLGGFQFAPAQSTPGSFQTVEMTVQDMTGDGVVDVVLLSTSQGTSKIRILQNNGAGDFLQINSILLQEIGVHSLAVADANNDGRLDLAVSVEFPFEVDSPGEAWIFLAEAPNVFQEPIKIAPLPISGLTGRVSDVRFPDLDGDGRIDMVIAANYGPPSVQRLHVYRGVGTSQQYFDTFDAPTAIGKVRFFDQFDNYSPDLFAICSGVPVSAANLTPMAPPGAFSLLSPANGSQGLVPPTWPGATARLDWTDSAAFHRTYDLHIGDEDGNLVHSALGLTESHYDITEGVLQAGRRYQWTVRARNATGGAAPSPIQIFTFTTAIPQDLTHDGTVNGADLANLLANWGLSNP